MSDWDTSITIGSKTRGGGGQRESVVKGKSALNAAMRTGSVVATEKKYTVGNAATKPGPEGQRLTKVDRSDDIVKVNTVGTKVGKAISTARNSPDSPLAKAIALRDKADPKTVTQSQLGAALKIKAADVAKFEAGTATRDGRLLRAMETQLGVKLTGSEELIGTPLPAKGKKAAASKGDSSKGESSKGKGK
ncbi:MAG: multiprotein-bridging factor 1 [Trichoglossum hirsutum]|nr:MAG: multiprotein-bridging factor 1 [Trichoglossum hirsutum]